MSCPNWLVVALLCTGACASANAACVMNISVQNTGTAANSDVAFTVSWSESTYRSTTGVWHPLCAAKSCPPAQAINLGDSQNQSFKAETEGCDITRVLRLATSYSGQSYVAECNIGKENGSAVDQLVPLAWPAQGQPAAPACVTKPG
jgi:hypothetical protein